jgi:lysine 6-dehydrogenase
MPKSIVVLGGGMVGGFIARTLAEDSRFAVTLCDRDRAALEHSKARSPMTATEADLADPDAIRKLVATADLVVGAVPGFMGYRTLQTLLEAGKNVVDISFFPEDPFSLDEIAKHHGVLAVVDCGVMPGLGGMIAVDTVSRFDEAERLLILVGGLPVERKWPTEYKAPFSPIDVIEEYVRPARYRMDGRIVVRPALSEPELVDIPGVGTLEAFNTDGLRTLLRTLHLPDMREKTLRYPGHIEKMRMLRELGFFDETPRNLPGGTVRPVDLTAQLLFAEWKLHPGTQELTALRIEVEGMRGGRRVVERTDLLDRTDSATGDSSMARTTGLPAVVAATLFLEGRIPERGIVASELLGKEPARFAEIRERLGRRGVVLRTSSSG